MCHNLGLRPVPIAEGNSTLECGIVFLESMVTKEKSTYAIDVIKNTYDYYS